MHKIASPRKPAALIESTCLGCGTSFIGVKWKRYCTYQCGWVHKGRIKSAETSVKKALINSIPRSCSNPSCDQLFMGNPKQIYCSKACRQRVAQNKYVTTEYSRRAVARRTAKNIQISPPCFICGKTTARTGHRKLDPSLLARVPEGIILCKSHFKGFHAYINHNSYQSYNMDEVFNAYLVSKTFTSTTRVLYLQMMRDAFNAKGS